MKNTKYLKYLSMHKSEHASAMVLVLHVLIAVQHIVTIRMLDICSKKFKCETFKICMVVGDL